MTPQEPTDEDSKLSTVDVALPSELELDDIERRLFLSPFAASQVEEFVHSAHEHDLLLANGLTIPNRLLLHGPPGTGKTSIARLIAKKLGLPLVTSRSDTLVSSLLGQTSRNIREVFDYASSWPCVLFLDEFDALAKNRADLHEVGELQRVVIALLQNLDATSPSTVLIAATNHPQLLDPAIWRRFSLTIKTDLPGHLQRRLIFENRLRIFGAVDKDVDVLSMRSQGLSGAAVEAAALDIARVQVLSRTKEFDLPRAARRLARIIWYEHYEIFNDEGSEIRTLRDWLPEVFTIRALAETFEMSTRQVQNHLGAQENDRVQPDSDAAVRATGAHS